MNLTPVWNSELALQKRSKLRSDWENDFDKNQYAFADELAKGISQEIFTKLHHTLEEAFFQEPSAINTLKSNYSFEITQFAVANRFKELAPNGCNKISPFKEWIQKFSEKKQKVDKDDIFTSCSIVKKQEFGIDGDYFHDIMAIIGKIVEKKLTLIFNTFSSAAENSNVKFKIEGFNKAGDNPTSYSKDQTIKIDMWIDSKIKPLPTIQSKARNAIEFQKKNRVSMEYKKTAIQISLVLGAFFAFFLFAQFLSIFNNKKT